MLRWLQSTGSGRGARDVSDAVVDEQSCPGMARALARILSKDEQPEVLDLGQFSRSAAVYLANRGARVAVDNFAPPPPSPPRRKSTDRDGEDEPPKVPVALRYPDRKFDLVLAWEHGDFVPPDRLAEFAAEVGRVLVPGGWLLMYCQDLPDTRDARQDRPACYRLTSDDRVLRTPTPGPGRPRWSHPNRAIERALAPLTVQSIHLQRNRIREILARKPERTRSA